MNPFPLTIAAVDEVFFEGEVLAVTCPGQEGELTVLRSHESFVTPLKTGNIRVQSDSGDKTFEIEKGILEVHRGGATILL